MSSTTSFRNFNTTTNVHGGTSLGTFSRGKGNVAKSHETSVSDPLSSRLSLSYRVAGVVRSGTVVQGPSRLLFLQMSCPCRVLVLQVCVIACGPILLGALPRVALVEFADQSGKGRR